MVSEAACENRAKSDASCLCINTAAVFVATAPASAEMKST